MPPRLALPSLCCSLAQVPSSHARSTQWGDTDQGNSEVRKWSLTDANGPPGRVWESCVFSIILCHYHSEEEKEKTSDCFELPPTAG